MRQPKLRFWLAEYFGKAKTATGYSWQHEEKMDDGAVRLIPLIPMEPEASAGPGPCKNRHGMDRRE